MKQLILFVLVLSATCLHAQQRPEIRIKLDVQLSSETFCVRNDGFLFVFDRNEFFKGDLKKLHPAQMRICADTFELDMKYNPNVDNFYDFYVNIYERINELLEKGRAEVYTPDGRVLRELDMVSGSFLSCVGGGHYQWYYLPGTQTRIFSAHIGFTTGCPSF